MASASFESRTVSSRMTSWRRGVVQDDDIFIDIDDVFAMPEVLLEFNTPRHSL